MGQESDGLLWPVPAADRRIPLPHRNYRTPAEGGHKKQQPDGGHPCLQRTDSTARSLYPWLLGSHAIWITVSLLISRLLSLLDWLGLPDLRALCWIQAYSAKQTIVTHRQNHTDRKIGKHLGEARDVRNRVVPVGRVDQRIHNWMWQRVVLSSNGPNLQPVNRFKRGGNAERLLGRIF